MKRIWMRAALALGLCAALLLAGCAQPGFGSALEEDPPALTDPLTGGEAQRAGQRVAAVAIENAPGTATQWGVASASLVMEALTRSDRPTSLCLVYPSLDRMPRTGPVAAGQDLYWRLLAAQQVLPVQRGGGVYNRNYLDFYGLHAIDAREVGRRAFDCTEGWSNAPLWYTSGAAAAQVLERLNISAALSVTGANASTVANPADGSTLVTVPALLPFDAQARLPEPGAEGTATVQLRFGAQSATGCSYDAEHGVYRMLRADGTPQMDANNGAQAAFDHLLVLYSASALREDGVSFEYDLSMGGGVWMNGGRLWHITWRQGTASTFAFYDADGEPLAIPPGRCYLALVSSLTGQELSVRSAQGEELASPH